VHPQLPNSADFSTLINRSKLMPRFTFLLIGSALGWAIGTSPDAETPRAIAKASYGALKTAVAPQDEIRNVMDLLAAVRELPPIVCGFTAEAASGWGGRGWYDAPSTPLGSETALRVASFPRGALRLSQISVLVDSLSSPSDCVRELSVRLVGRVDAEIVEERLIERLARGDSLTRDAPALGLR
jgi:hypothetical protein